MIFLFVLFLPCLMSALFYGNWGNEGGGESFSMQESRLQVCLKLPGGDRVISMEEYLCGALPLVIPAEYEPECLKAQAILLRTGCIRRYLESAASSDGMEESAPAGNRMEDVSSAGNRMEEPADSYLTVPELKELWGSSYPEYMEKISQAVNSTKGVYLTFGGQPVEPCYFRVSAGSTRDGAEVLGEEFSYLRSTACPRDYLASGYLSEAVIKKREAERILGGSLGKVSRDSAGYCTMISIEKEGKICSVSGEAIREKLSLASAAFTFSEEKGSLVFRVKGVGHGLGMSQFAANELALQGADYNTILSIFFKNTALDKYE